MKSFPIFIFLFAITFLVSCSNQKVNDAKENKQESEKNSLLPYSTGTISTLYLYVDNSFENSDLVDSIKYHLNQPYLLTPNLAPVVDISNYSFQTFASDGARPANNLMVINVQEESAMSNYVKQQLGQTQVAEAVAEDGIALIRVKDINATPQQVFYLLSNGIPNLSSAKVQNAIKDYAFIIIEHTTEIDNERLITGYSRSRDVFLENKIAEMFKINIKIPDNYETMKEGENFLWIIHETPKLYSNLVFYKRKNNPDYSLEKQVIAIRDEFGKKVNSNRENSRMTTHVSSKPYPITKELEINGKRVIETRGLWKMVNDKLGGGFVNYAFKRKDTIFVVDGFVFYAGDDKRRQMRTIDAILSTIELE